MREQVDTRPFLVAAQAAERAAHAAYEASTQPGSPSGEYIVSLLCSLQECGEL